jgi:hypothetical protein
MRVARKDHAVLDRLKLEQEELVGILDRAKLSLDQPVLSDARSVGKSRWEFVRLLMRHCAFKDAYVYPDLIARQPLLGERQKIECRTLYDDYVMHMQTWHANAILSDWTRFRFASLALASRIREHIKCERREVYPFFSLPEVKITPQPLPYKPPTVP